MKRSGDISDAEFYLLAQWLYSVQNNIIESESESMKEGRAKKGSTLLIDHHFFVDSLFEEIDWLPVYSWNGTHMQHCFVLFSGLSYGWTSRKCFSK